MPKKLYSPWRPLRDPRLLLICGILLGATAITGFLNYISVRESAENAAIEELAGEARLIGFAVKNAYLKMERDAIVVSHTPPVQGIIRSRRDGSGVDAGDTSSEQQWRARLETILIAIMELRPEYTQMRYLGFSDGGREIVRINREGDTLQAVPVEELQQKSQEPYMQQALGLEPGEVAFSDITMNREHGEVTGGPTLRLMVTVFDSGSKAPFGVIVVNADYESLLQQTLAEVKPPHLTYVISDNSDYLVFEPKAGPGKLQFHKSFSGSVPDIVAEIHGSPNEESALRVGDNIAYFVRQAVSDDDNTGLLVASVVPRETLLAPARRIRAQVIFLGLTLLASVAAFTWLLIRHYTAPLTDMTNTVLRSENAKDLPVERDDELGALARAFVTLTDNLEGSEARFRAILDTVNDGIITIDKTGTIISVNPACKAIFGYSADECVGQNIKMLMPPTYSEHHDRYLQQYDQTGKRSIIGYGREVEGMRKDGSVFPLDLSVSEMRVHGQRMFTGIVRDISQRKQAEARMEEQREFLDLVMNTNPNFVYVFDSDMKIIQANQAFREAVFNSDSGIFELQVLAGFFSEDELKEGTDAKIEAFRSGYSELTQSRLFPDGKRRNLFIQNVRFENAAGEQFILSVARDQTELEKLTGRLKQSNKELDEFAYVASHDLKAPLRVIDNASTWLVEDLGETLDEDSLENLQLIRSRVSRMERLLDDLLTYSRIGRKMSADEEEIISGETLLDDILHLLSPSARTRVTVSETFSTIMLPRMPLQQIFLNLISNAFKHAESEDLHVHVDLDILPNDYKFSVSDNGPGIPAEYQEQVFQMFQTLKPRDVVEGSGMGLAIVRKHIEQHGGRIWLESEASQGATFHFTWKDGVERLPTKKKE